MVLVDNSLKIKNKQNTETGDSRYTYQNELEKACYQHDMTYDNFKNLNSRTAADKVLHNKASNIARKNI